MIGHPRVSVINYFGPSMYQSLGLNAGQSLLIQGIYGAVGPITNIMSATSSHLYHDMLTRPFQIHHMYNRLCRKKETAPAGRRRVCRDILHSDSDSGMLPAGIVRQPPRTSRRNRDDLPHEHPLLAEFWSDQLGADIRGECNPDYENERDVTVEQVFPTKTRSIGTSVAVCANWAFNVLFSQVS